MSQLTAKELRFADAAIEAALDASQRQHWAAWYLSAVMGGGRASGVFTVPADMAQNIVEAIQLEKARLRASLEDASEDDEADLVNDLEVFLHMEREVT